MPPASRRVSSARSTPCSRRRRRSGCATSTSSSARSSRQSRTWPGSRARKAKCCGPASPRWRRSLVPLRRHRHQRPRLRPAIRPRRRPDGSEIPVSISTTCRYKPRQSAAPTPLEAGRGYFVIQFKGIPQMATIQQLKAMARPRGGKGAARAQRRQGRVPGVIYGDNKDPITISVDHAELKRRIYAGRFLSTIYEIELEGAKHRVIPRDFQLDPVKDLPVHVDFMRLGKRSEEHTSELQSLRHLVCRLLLEKQK